MNLPHAVRTKGVRTDPRNEISTQLSGRWLVFARVLWIILFLLILAVIIIISPAYITVETAQTQQSLGKSVGAYLGYSIALTFASMAMCIVVAIVIYWRKSNDWRALLVALMLLMISTTVITNELQVPHFTWEIPALILNIFAFATLFLVFSFFPNGRFVPKWIGWLTIVWIVWGIIFTIFRSIPHFIHTLVWLCSLICLAVAQVYRYRNISSLVQRQQTKWVVFGLSAAIIVVIGVATPQLIFPSLNQLGSFYPLIKTPCYTCALFLGSLSFGIAILHSRLWDIDVLINRTLVYGTLTLTLAFVYFSLVIGLQFLLRGLFSQMNGIIIVGSTLVIIALFQPLHHRIQRIIDRRFFRSKYNAALILAAFNTKLRNEVDLNQISEQLVDVVQETMQPAHISLWLRKPERNEKHWERMP